MGEAQLLVFGANFGRKFPAPLVAEEGAGHPHRPRRIHHMHHRPLRVVRVNFNGRVNLARRRPANQQRHGESLAAHLPRHVAHLLERGGDEATQPNHIHLMLPRRLQNLLRRNHHPEVNHLVAVTAQNHSHDIFADVMHIPFHGGHQNFAVGLGVARGHFFLFDKGHEVGHPLFHHPCAFDHLGQEHFARPKQVANDVHAVHQRAFNDLNRPCKQMARLLHILLHKGVDAVDKGIR